MFTFIGIFITLICIIAGYLMHHGNLALLIQPNEIVILVGAAIGSMLSGYGLKTFQGTIQSVLGLLKPDVFVKDTYLDLLKMMYKLFTIARKDGLLGLEKHVEEPENSDVIKKFPVFLSNHHAVSFLCDTMKVILTGTVSPHDLSEMMELDLETAHQETGLTAEALQTVGDAMPGFGIVAAVLGIIITMGKIGGEASEIGMSVGAALVGTFLGILLAYGVFAPMSKALELKNRSESQYLNCIRYALVSFARGESPITCVEFARRNIEPHNRPGFTEMETAVKQKDV